MSSPNTNFDAIASSTLRNYLNKTFSDNVFFGLPLYAWLIKNGRKTNVDGGEFLVEPLMFDTNKTVKWLAGYDTVDVTPQDGLTAAQFNWKMIGGSVSFSVLEQAKNAGRSQVIDLLDAKIEQCKLSFQSKFNTDLYSDGTTDNSNAVTGLGAMVNNTGTYGNINRATFSFWQSIIDSTIAVLNEDDMRNQYNNQSKNITHPTFILTTQPLYQKYEALVVPAYRTEDRRVADLGFMSLQFKGVPIVYDDACTSSTMFFLNDNYLKLRVSTGNDMVWTDKREPINQFTFTQLVRWIGNLTCNNARFQGKLTNRSAS